MLTTFIPSSVEDNSQSHNASQRILHVGVDITSEKWAVLVFTENRMFRKEHYLSKYTKGDNGNREV